MALGWNRRAESQLRKDARYALLESEGEYRESCSRRHLERRLPESHGEG